MVQRKKGGKNDEIKPNWKEFPQLFSRTDKWKHHFLQRKTAFKTVIIRDMKYVKKNSYSWIIFSSLH